jgi:hypothetical protein
MQRSVLACSRFKIPKMKDVGENILMLEPKFEGRKMVYDRAVQQVSHKSRPVRWKHRKYSRCHAHACLQCSNPGGRTKECLAAVSDWVLPDL